MNKDNKIIVFPFQKRTKVDNAINPWNVAIQEAEEHSTEYPPDIDSVFPNEGGDAFYELNNLLNNIYGESQLIELYMRNEEISDKEVFTKSTGSIKKNCLRLTKALNNIIELRKIQEKQFCLCVNKVNIVEIIDDIVINVSNIIKKRKIIFDTDVEEKYVSCDVSKFQKAILILLSNAIKYSSEKEVFVNLNIVENNINITISFKSRNSKLLKDFIDKMDNPNTDYFNSLGLYICKTIVDLHEGHIDVVGKEEEICFSLLLPCDNTDSIYYLFNNRIINDENLREQIQIEFSDIFC